MTTPCQTTPDGGIFPGEPGDTIHTFLARRAAEWEAYYEEHGASDVAVSRPMDRAGFWEYGR